MPAPDDPARLLGNDRRGRDLIRGESGRHDDPHGVWTPDERESFPWLHGPAMAKGSRRAQLTHHPRE
jgi:hypothetical protein